MWGLAVGDAHLDAVRVVQLDINGRPCVGPLIQRMAAPGAWPKFARDGRGHSGSPGPGHGPRIFSIISKGNVMNKDQVKGEIKEVAGKVQEKAGKVIGSTDQQVKGLAKQDEGKTQKAFGDVKEVVKETVKDVKKDVARK